MFVLSFSGSNMFWLLQVFDYSIDSETHEFCKWTDIIPTYSGTPAVGIPSDAYVHTVHAEVYIGLLYAYLFLRGARWLSGRVSDSGARGPGFETYRRRVVSLSKTLYSPKVLVNYPGSDGSVPT